MNGCWRARALLPPILLSLGCGTADVEFGHSEERDAGSVTSDPADASVPSEGDGALPSADGDAGGAGEGGDDGACPGRGTICDGKCGVVHDACGAAVPCGGCPTGTICGGGGPNVCGDRPCVPSCSGKACGADDGCGRPCAEGACGAGQRCASGVCRCDASSCAGCCSGATCLPGTSDTACGTKGAQCAACTSGTCGGAGVAGACGACPGPGCAARWKVLPTGTTETLYALWGRGSEDFFAAGTGATVLHTKDGGGSFEVRQVDRQSSTTAHTSLWAIGAEAFLASTNTESRVQHFDGSSWSLQTSDATSGHLYGLHGYVNAVGTSVDFSVWAVGWTPAGDHCQIRMLHKAFGSSVESWGAQSCPAAVPSLVAVWALTPTTVVAVGDRGAILRTTNGGLSWAAVSSPVTTTLAAVFGTGGLVLAVGAGGVILRSEDAGASWVVVPSGVTGPLAAVWGSSSSDLWVSGASATLLHSADGGKTWQKQLGLPTTAGLYAVWGTGSDVFIAGSAGTILKKE